MDARTYEKGRKYGHQPSHLIFRRQGIHPKSALQLQGGRQAAFLYYERFKMQIMSTFGRTTNLVLLDNNVRRPTLLRSLQSSCVSDFKARLLKGPANLATK